MKRSAFLLLLAACGNSPSAKPAAQAPGVTEDKLLLETEPAENPGYVAVVAPRKTGAVTSEISAKIERVHVQMGETVKAGAPIVTLDAKKIQDELRSAQANAAAARAAATGAALEASSARRTLELESSLSRQGVSSAETVRQAKIAVQKAGAGYAQMAAQAERAEGEVQRLERALTDSTLRAPIDGVVSLVRAREGDLVNAGHTVVRILAPGDWQLRFAVSNKEGEKIKKGMRVTFSTDEDIAAKPVTATVTHVSPALEPPLELVVIEAEFDPADMQAPILRAGRVGRVHLVTEKPKAPTGGS